MVRNGRYHLRWSIREKENNYLNPKLYFISLLWLIDEFSWLKIAKRLENWKKSKRKKRDMKKHSAKYKSKDEPVKNNEKKEKNQLLEWLRFTHFRSFYDALTLAFAAQTSIRLSRSFCLCMHFRVNAFL